MRREDVEDGFWLGLLGPSRYLASRTLREVHELRMAVERTQHQPVRDDAPSEWDALEADIEAAAARMRDVAARAEALMDANPDDDAYEAAWQAAIIEARELGSAELPAFQALSAWADSLPEVEGLDTEADVVMAKAALRALRESMRSYVEHCAYMQSDGGGPDLGPELGDLQWGSFKSWTARLAERQARRANW